MALLNTWASQQDPSTLSPLDKLLNNYIQSSNAPAAYLMRGDAKGLLQDLNTPRPVNITKDMTDVALNANPIMGLIGATAYHGSPHLFNKFDISKLGTGEGAQVYGHGMYFAEHPDVAKSYVPRDFKSEEKLSKLYDQAEQKGHYAAMQIYEDLMLHKMPNEISLADFTGNDLVQAQNALKQGTKIYQSQKGANLYKVDIPDEYMPNLLHWDKPIKDQPDIYKLIKNNIKDSDIRKTFETNAESGISGANAYANYLGGKTDAERSKNALNMGIKGIRYFDEGSRTNNAGTSNFVIFDPSQIKILERNNKGLLGE